MIKNKKTKMIKQFAKIISILLVAVINWCGLSAVFGTYAAFSDLEISADNAFAAGILSFTAIETPLPNYNPCGEGEVSPERGSSPAIDAYRRIDLSQVGTLDFNYSISIINLVSSTTNVDVCDNLTIDDGIASVVLDGYELSAPLVYSATSTLNFTFHLISDDPLLMKETCDFDYVIKAWQTNLAEDAGGFTDTQMIHSSVTADPWVIEVEGKAEEQVPDMLTEEKIGGGDTDDKIELTEQKEEEKNESEPPAELKKEEDEDPVEKISEPATDAGGEVGGGQSGPSEGAEGGDGGGTGSEGGVSEGE